jgi:hypothetical protein
MDHAPADSHPTGSPTPSLLRQRMLNRASTIAEGARPASPKQPRRRSSLLSNLSDSNHALRPSSSSDNLRRASRSYDMDKLTSSDESTWWHSTPILIAVVPAVAALYHPHGGTFATDIVLLLLGAWFMHKCYTVPWDWYHDAQQRQYVHASELVHDDTLYEEDEDGTTASPGTPDSALDSAEETKSPAKSIPPTLDPVHEAARQELRRTEMLAFTACFLGPVLGAYLLHTIRSQFTHESQDRIVTDMNLTICVLLAEMRPISRLIKMNKERTLHLQRVVSQDPHDQSNDTNAQALAQRLAALETHLEGPTSKSNVDVTQITSQVRLNVQRQVDELHRTVRAYEKKLLAMTIQNEARFQEIETRMKDTLSLAAAAARSGQKPGVVSMALSFIASVFAYGLQFTWDVATYPIHIANVFVGMVKSSFSKDTQNTKKRVKGPYNGYATTPRVQSKSSR